MYSERKLEIVLVWIPPKAEPETRIWVPSSPGSKGDLGEWNKEGRKSNKKREWDFPVGAVVKTPPASAGDTGSSPGLGRSHMLVAAEQLSPCVTTTEARAPRACAPQQREATAMRSPHTATKSSPHSPQLEKARAQQWRPNAAKSK